jgi:multidrug resistance protein MdtO
MASIAQASPARESHFTWLWQWLRDELSPYPGRMLLAARMVIAGALIMIISMTFRLPCGAYGALFALNVSRESLEVTRSAVRTIIIGFVLAGAYLLAGAMLVIGDPLLRFAWIVATLFLAFYGSSASGNLAGWVRFGYVAVITVSLWDQHISAQARIDGLLWAIGMLTMSSVVALVLEMGYAALRRGDDLLDPLADRLASVERLLRCYSDGRPIEADTQSAVTRFAMLGTSRLRRLLTRYHKDAQHAPQMGAVVALVGRLVDLAAGLPEFVGRVSDADRVQVAELANHITTLRHDLKNGLVPRMAESVGEPATWAGPQHFGQIDRTVRLIREAFWGSLSLKIFDPASRQDAGIRPALAPFREFKREHLHLGLKGCLAASLCYILYSALFWPEISTSVTTCYLTALSTIGSSRQKQVLRIGGAVLGGFALGMGAQVFILPT